MCLSAQKLLDYNSVMLKAVSDEQLNNEEINFLKKNHLEERFMLLREQYILSKMDQRE